jgi:hypothetical protein
MKQLLAALLFVQLAFGSDLTEPDQADITFTSGNLYTVNDKQPTLFFSTSY